MSGSSQVRYVSNMSDYESLTAEHAEDITCFYFTASWCGPCQRVAPAIDALAQQWPAVRFFKVDVDEPELATLVDSAGVTSVPMFVFKKGEEQLKTIIGANIEEITQFVQLLAAASEKKTPAEVKTAEAGGKQ